MLFLKRPYKKKPARIVWPNLRHPYLQDCLLWMPLFDGPTQSPVNVIDKNGQAAVEPLFWEGGDTYFDGNSTPSALGLNLTSDDFDDEATVIMLLRNHMHIQAGTANSAIWYIHGHTQSDFYPWTNGTIYLGAFRNDRLTVGAVGIPDRTLWHTLAVTQKPGAGNWKVYQNGQEIFSANGEPTVYWPAAPTIGRGLPTNYYYKGWIRDVKIYNRALSQSEILALSDNPWAPMERRIWVFTEAPGPPQPIVLDIADLRHGRPVDDVSVTVLVTQLVIDGLRHVRPVDDVPTLGVSVDLFLASLRHARSVDDVAIVASVDLGIDALTHGRRTDAVDLQELVGVVIDIDDARHGRPVDALLLDVEQPILIDGLRHGRPVDAVDVQLLMGDQTGMGATASAWVLNAGQTLNNASSIDFGYHVLEGVFDGNQSVLGVDGSRVTGAAGLRELTVLTLGADVDGQRRMQGEIAELRIYAGALSQADRDRITQELATKWITG